ncbi:MAG TPA: hypothetical protein VHQ46_04405 [Desulfobacteria bacterium]|nr:hypothetical protein [Desulfobacteria bacterium]
MQYIYSLLTLALQSVGQLSSLLLGWLIAFHFGRVPTRQKYVLSAMGGISFIWATMALSLGFPWVRHGIVQVTTGENIPFYLKLIVPLAGVGWILLPLVNGLLGMYLKQQSGVRRMRAYDILRGYKYTPGFAIAILLMILSLPALIIPPLIRGFQREHLLVMIGATDYGAVVSEIDMTLQHHGFTVQLRPGRLWRRSPVAILAFFAHDLIGDWTKTRARLIKGDNFYVIVYPTDLVIEGSPPNVVLARNILAKELTFSEAFFTWDGQAHALEEKINAVRKRILSGDYRVLPDLASLESRLDHAPIPYGEWQTLYRQILQLKLDCLTHIYQ